MTTALDQIKGALRLIGELAEGESPSSDTTIDSLSALNQMLDSWSIERLAVYTTQDQTFTWPASTKDRTFGPTGDFVGTRPVDLDDSTYFIDTSTGVSYGIGIINDQQYNQISVKTVTSTYPQLLWVDDANPDINMSIYPVAIRALEWHFISVLELAQPTTSATSLVFPPGYLRAFRYNLAVELAGEFGVEPSSNVSRIAMTSKRSLKRINNPDDVMSFPSQIVSGRQRYNVFAGNI